MIRYNNRDMSFLFFMRAGSVLVSKWVLGPAVLSTLFCCVLLIVSQNERVALIPSKVARIYAGILAFVIVFRTDMAFNRFWDGVGHVQVMFSKWRDSFNILSAFLESSINKHISGGKTAEVESLLLSKARLLHWFSLLAAQAVATLQAGEDDTPEKVINRFNIRKGPENRMEHPSLSSGRGSLAVMPTESTKFIQNSKDAHTVPVQPVTPTHELEVLGEITETERLQILNSRDVVLTVVKWILYDISHNSIQGKMLIPPPILSRVYQEISNGMLAFFRANTIATVPFPFPFAQVLEYALLAFYIFCPFIVLEIADPDLAGFPGTNAHKEISIPLLLNFFACAGYAAINQIAVEIENPFGFDTNDFPVHHQQWDIVTAIEDSFFTETPREFGEDNFKGDKATWPIPA